MANSSTGYRMKSGNVRVPDVSFVLLGRVPHGSEAERFLDGAPDLAIEIISESEDRSDAARKIVEYFESGAQQVWTVQPLTQSVTVYHSLDRVRTWEAHEELTGGDLLPGFHCHMGEIFATG
jgi:Uma2 family endonuclease